MIRRPISYLAVSAALSLGAVAPPALAQATGGGDGKTLALSKSSVFFELNDTDGDLGIHILLDGEGWKTMRIDDPNGARILDVEVKGRLQLQGLTELFSESAEPSFDDLPPEEFFQRFPEGEYKITGETLDGMRLEGSDTLSHVMPAPPGEVTVSGAEAPSDCDEGPVPAVAKPVVISWKPVTQSHPELGKTAAVEIVNYELVVSREAPTPVDFGVDLPPGVTSFEVPRVITDLDDADQFKFEIVVREASGNQTVLESCFKLKK